MNRLRLFGKSLLAPLAGLTLSLALGSLFLLVIGESPKFLWEALYTVYATNFGLGYTLFYSTPLIFTGLSVALCFHCGLFNIGAEGQLYIGSICIVIIASLFPHLPWGLAVPLGVLTAALVGGLWGAIAGLLKALRGSHEVIVTILLNFMAIALVDYLILYPLANVETQNPESRIIANAYALPTLNQISAWVGLDLFKSTPANATLFLAIGTAFLVHFFLFKTSWGFEIRTVGNNPRAARFAGVSVNRNIALALFLSGMLAGLVGVNEVQGYEHKVIQSFSPGYGFTGIAVALLARNHPVAIILSALLFGGLHNSARELEFLSEKVSKELSLVLQGVLIAFVAADALWKRWIERRKAKHA